MEPISRPHVYVGMTVSVVTVTTFYCFTKKKFELDGDVIPDDEPPASLERKGHWNWQNKTRFPVLFWNFILSTTNLLLIQLFPFAVWDYLRIYVWKNQIQRTCEFVVQPFLPSPADSAPQTKTKTSVYNVPASGKTIFTFWPTPTSQLSVSKDKTACKH